MQSLPFVTPFLTVSRDGLYFVMNLVNEDNRFSIACMSAWQGALDYIEQTRANEKGPTALITKSAHPKIFSNGLSLEEAFMSGASYFQTYQNLLARILTFPMPTIAVINGHAFAGGCMLAFAHDYRVMRSDLGFMCMNEVDIPLPVSPGMGSIIRTKISNPLEYRRMILEGHRYDGNEALKVGLIDALATSESSLYDQGKTIADKFSKKVAHPKMSGKVYQFLKLEMYRDLHHTLTNDTLGYVPEFMKLMNKAKL